jgi:flagellar biosynthetic protein FlhB
VPAQERTEQPTQKRREESRRKGQVARTPDAAAAIALLGGFGILAVTGPWMLRRLEETLARGLTLPGRPELTVPVVADVARNALLAIALVSGPVLAAALIFGVLGNVAQVRLRLTPQALKPTFSRIDPVAGAKRLFGAAAAMEFVKNAAKLAAIGGIAFLSVRSEWDRVLLLAGTGPEELLVVTAKLAFAVSLKIGAALAVIALADYAWQRRRLRKQLMMTKQEVKEEAKQTDMSPLLRGRIKQAQRSATRVRMLSAVAAADVVVLNPTHYAVALSYREDQGAPRVVAKGRDLVAARIRELATDNDVPRVENPPLARALYRTVEVGHEIPEELFAAVAEVLAFVYRLQNRRLGAA